MGKTRASNKILEKEEEKKKKEQKQKQKQKKEDKIVIGNTPGDQPEVKKRRLIKRSFKPSRDCSSSSSSSDGNDAYDDTEALNRYVEKICNGDSDVDASGDDDEADDANTNSASDGDSD